MLNTWWSCCCCCFTCEVTFLCSVPVRPDAPAEVQKSGVQPWHCCHKLIYVRPNPKTGVPIGHWPIPEAFWPDQNSPTLVREILFIPLYPARPKLVMVCMFSWQLYSEPQQNNLEKFIYNVDFREHRRPSKFAWIITWTPNLKTCSCC